jgi:steroid 5-alpha reductase family enzyme
VCFFSLFLFFITARLTQNSFSKAESLTIALLLLPVIQEALQSDHRKSPFKQNPNNKFFSVPIVTQAASKGIGNKLF